MKNEIFISNEDVIIDTICKTLDFLEPTLRLPLHILITDNYAVGIDSESNCFNLYLVHTKDKNTYITDYIRRFNIQNKSNSKKLAYHWELYIEKVRNLQEKYIEDFCTSIKFKNEVTNELL